MSAIGSSRTTESHLQLSSILAQPIAHDAQGRWNSVARTLFLKRITGRLALRYVDNTMHIEADLLSACRPSFVTEAVDMFAVVACIEAVIAGGNGFLVYDVHVCRVNNLEEQ